MSFPGNRVAVSSGSLDPLLNPQDWDVITLGGQVSPGICKVSEFPRAHEWDQKKGKGTLGATLTYVGRPLAKGSITFRLWTSLHFQQWDLFRPLFKYDPTKTTAQGVDIYHPSLVDVEINSVVCEEIGNIIHAGDGLYTITVKLVEYAPPPKASAVSTPTTSKTTTTLGPGSPPGAPPDPVADAQQKEIQRLMQQASAP